MPLTTSRRLLRHSAAALAFAALSGCSMFSNHNPKYDPVPLTEYPAAISAAVSWSVPVGSGGGYGFAPMVVQDTVFAATPDGKVVSANVSTGQIRWQTALSGELSAGVGSDGVTTAVVGIGGTVIALDEQGRERWRTRASSAVNMPPTVGDGVVVVRTTDYRIQAFDAATGEPRWSVQRPGPALALQTNMRMLSVQGLVISGLPNGRLMAIEAATGNVQWEGTVSASYGATDLERINDVVGTPQIQGPLLCGVTYQGRIVCFDISRGGMPVWEQPFSSNTGMTSDPQQVYAATRRDTVYAFRLDDGTEVWKQAGLANRQLSGPAVLPQAVAFGDLEGYIHFLSRTDGRLLGRVQVGDDPIVSPLVATPSGFIVQTGEGRLLRVSVN
ncbi:MAG: outer membrane protein assembly factor BamB [Burkholderiaceae bacterium]